LTQIESCVISHIMVLFQFDKTSKREPSRASTGPASHSATLI